MKQYFVYFFILLTALVYTNYPNTSSAQWDDPNFDRIPTQILDINSFFSSPSAIVTIGDYDNFDIGVDFAEVHITENPINPLQYFCAYNTNGTHYTINGHDWLRQNPVFPSSAGDPVTAYDSLGTLYYDNMKSPITGTWIVKSTNNSQTWSTAVSANVGNDKNWIAADQSAGPYTNYIYGAMTPGNFVRSTDRGATFTTTFSSSNTLPGNMTAVGPWNGVSGGAVYYVKSTGSAFAAVYTFHLSTDGGATFTTQPAQTFANYVGTFVGGRNSVQNMRTRPYPFIAVDNSYGPYRGRLYVIYASNNPAGDLNKPDIFCRYSTDGAATWSSPVVVNDDPNSQNHNQWMPAPWCDKNTGKLYVQWMDTRDTPTSDSALQYATYSTDGGQTFVANQKISNKKYRINCTSCGGGGTPLYLGDYNSIVSNEKTSMLAWTDFRNNNFGSYVAYFPDFGMRVNPTTISINNGNFATFKAVIPSVKLYTDVTTFTATVTPPPANGALTVSFPNGNTLSNYPDSIIVRVAAAPNTTAGNYTVTVTAAGSNGTPVHKRTVALTVGLVGVNGLSEIPNSYELSQNYPNPFNPSTRINYTLRNQTEVTLSVFDAMGRMVA
ncbi:MAG: sialidase family protein, partial [bacterium]|nr:sialidase family protein [bacterium]